MEGMENLECCHLHMKEHPELCKINLLEPKYFTSWNISYTIGG